jgi:hypothetical protein
MIHYVVCVHPDRVTIIGPYATQTAAVARGQQWQRQNNDNPAWMATTLPNGAQSVRFLTPPQGRG